MFTQIDSDFILDCQLREISSLLVKNYYPSIEIDTNTLILNVPEIASLTELEAIEQKIGAEVYLKLGCKRISFYCYQNYLWHYNTDIRIDESNNMTAALLTNSVIETQSELNEQRQQPQIAIDWISFEGIAQSLGCETKVVSKEVQAFGIFVTLHSDTLGLSGENLEIYLNRRHNQMVEKFRGLLVKSTTPSRAAASLKAVPASSSNGSTDIQKSGLMLPSDFDMMNTTSASGKARARRPDIRTALKLAIASLPDGNDEQIKKMYVRQIAMREESENFVSALANQFGTSPKLKNAAAVTKEIYNTARQLWDEYLDAGT